MLALVAVVLLSPTPLGAQSDGTGDVEVDVSAGIDGEIGSSRVFPVTVGLSSPRSRTVELEVNSESEYRSLRVELPAGTRVEIPVSMSPPPYNTASFRVTAEVRDSADRLLGSGRAEVVPRSDLTTVGVGASFGPVEQARVRTIGGIQDAQLVSLSTEQWTRPGVLESLSGVVLGAADLDALGDEERDLLRSWVWRGGNLALDVPHSDPLPVVDLAAAAGERTPVGQGWVRFTEGRAATGPWTAVVEPAVARQTLENWGGMWIGNAELIDIDFIPPIAVVIAVFGTALVAGPLLWLLLKRRGRQRLMWVLSPALSVAVAGGLLALGQGVFTRAEPRALAQVELTPWSARGDAVFGLKGSTEVRLTGDAQVNDAAPEATVSEIGGARTASVGVPRNGFGFLAFDAVQLDDSPDIEVTAVAAGNDGANVTVTNHGDQPFVDVTVRTAGRVRPFGDVAAGESVTLPFLVNRDLQALGELFPFDGESAVPVQLLSQQAPSLPMTRGVVFVSGLVQGRLAVAGLAGDGRSIVQVAAPITSEQPDPAALRIEVVGTAPTAGLDEFGEMIIDDLGEPTTTIADPGIAGPDASAEVTTGYVRLSALAGRPSGTCGLHTAINEVSVWDGSGWSSLQRQGDPFESDRFVGPNETQNWVLPTIEPGAALYLRLGSNLVVRPPLVFVCDSANGGAS